ncbi:hypothetical protein [Aquidulcibacter paucihalophilus]|uniref:hypothetical protein n=1 Tax=Aquidulcibacter paucihalophilus TaxID=1978549 RepID=UPI0018E389FD|nr:hypothetical protein [Aquidulcibacter paucihalophilus]
MTPSDGMLQHPFSATIREERGQDGSIILVGPWRRPINLLKRQSYANHASIHDDATAQGLGFQGGTIEGPTHFSQFAPLLYHAFGSSWFDFGSISVTYKQASYEGEELQARMSQVASDSANLSMVKRDGTVVLMGNAGVGSPPENSFARQRLAASRALAEPRILAGCHPGLAAPKVCIRLDAKTPLGGLYPFSLVEKLDVITEPSPWYSEETNTPWTRAILPVEMISVLCQSVADQDPFPIRQPVVGLFADQEVVVIDGPLYPGVNYELERKIVHLSETPKTESMWIRTMVREKATSRLCAEMLLNQAFLKASSELYEF